MSSYTYFSDGFNLLLDVWPKAYLTFPSKEVRGLSVAKASIIIENVNNKPVAFRIVNEKNSTLDLRACPTHCILTPGAVQRVDILNTTDHSCGISDRVHIEAVIYEKNLSTPVTDNFTALFQENAVEYYGLKCYETNDLALIPMQDELFRVEQRLKSMELALKNFNHWFLVRNYSYPFMLMLIIFIGTLISLWAHHSLNQWATCHCIIKHRNAAHSIAKKISKPIARIGNRFDVTICDIGDMYEFVMKKQSPRRFTN